MAAGAAGLPGMQITVGRDALEQMKGQFERTWQRRPTAEEEKGLIEDLIRNEIFYREAIAIGLDRDDEVLKRRLRQKMEFIYEDISSWAEPSDAELADFMKKNREKYLADPQLSFRQVFISRDKRGKNAESDARQVLAQLTAGTDPDAVGDPTMLAAEAHRLPLREIKTQFGEEFGNGILELKSGAWAGPVRSSYGHTSDPVELARHVMEDADSTFSSKVVAGDIIIAGKNFGCGSSREHAPIAIKAAGIQAVVAKSFARIFYRNAFNIGLPIFESDSITETVREGDTVEIDGDSGMIRDVDLSREFRAKPIPPFMQELIAAGGLVEWTRKKIKKSA